MISFKPLLKARPAWKRLLRILLGQVWKSLRMEIPQNLVESKFPLLQFVSSAFHRNLWEVSGSIFSVASHWIKEDSNYPLPLAFELNKLNCKIPVSSLSLSLYLGSSVCISEIMIEKPRECQSLQNCTHSADCSFGFFFFFFLSCKTCLRRKGWKPTFPDELYISERGWKHFKQERFSKTK